MINASDPLELLDLRARPVAIAFLDAPPAGLAPWRGAAKPAGCAFWLDAQQGASFYTVASDHFNCAIGAYTHAIDLPPDRASELEGTIGLMVEGEYLEIAEVPGIPRLEHSPAVVAYAPVDDGAFAPRRRPHHGDAHTGHANLRSGSSRRCRHCPHEPHGPAELRRPPLRH